MLYLNMQLLFLLQNFHFAINIFGALALFSIAWLYYDAWTVKKSGKDLYKIIGFIFLSISFFSHSLFIESGLSYKLFSNSELHLFLTYSFRTFGYLMIITGLLTDPIQKKPKFTNLLIALLIYSSWKFLEILNPFLAVLSGILYFRKASLGLERHLNKISLAFVLMFVSEFGTLISLLKDTSNIQLYEFIAPFGPLWIIEHIVMLLSFSFIASWGFSYLLKRIQTQLFILFTTFILAIFLITTVTFTMLLSSSIQTENLRSLSSNAKMLISKIDSKKDEFLSDTIVLSKNSELIEALKTDSKNLNNIAQEYQLNKKQQSLVIVDNNGTVIARGEDRDNLGQSYSNNLLFKKVFDEQALTSLAINKEEINPSVYIQSFALIKDGDEVLGAVITENILDNLFIDQIKKATGLEISLYAENMLVATSIITPNSQRFLGLRESSKEINESVLQKGEEFKGELNLLNKDYFTVFVPLLDSDGVPIGMLFVAELQSGVFKLVSQSIALTFVITSLLFVISLFPSYLISRFVSDQLK